MAVKRISVLGSTGSIGRQALDIAQKFPDRFKVVGLSGGQNLKLLAGQTKKFKPRIVSVMDEDKAKALKKLVGPRVKIVHGEDGLNQLAAIPEAQLVLIALVGAAGLNPLLNAILENKIIALANKEPMVMAGKLVTDLLSGKAAKIIPVDSEHSAIFQLLNARPLSQVRRVILSASGGPFLRKKTRDLKDAGIREALRHPTWKMGKKISVDSATLMNKALELIEAKWLFGLKYDQIDVVIHPQSIVHSLVEMCDGAVFAHLSVPDMRIPIAFALFWPERPELEFQRLDLAKISELKFGKPDLKRFPALKLGFYALKHGATFPAVMSAADEEAVKAFLSGNIAFNKIVTIIDKVMAEHEPVEPTRLEDIMNADQWARARAKELICQR